MTSLVRHLPLIFAVLVIVAMHFETRGRPSAADAKQFHIEAAKAIEAIPAKFDSWDGVDIPVPASAQALLRPNAMLSRRYTNVRSGEQVSMMLVQCRDTRDMAGHYPPICYPGLGWVERDRGKVDLNFRGRAIQAMRYEFDQRLFDQYKTLVVYNFFAVPGQGLPIDMAAIRQAGSDYASRPFGAAQIQVAFARRRPAAEEKSLVESLLAPLGPAIDVLSNPEWRRR